MDTAPPLFLPSDLPPSVRLPRRIFSRFTSLASFPMLRSGATLPGSSAPLVSTPLEGSASEEVEAPRLQRSLKLSVAEGVLAEVVAACAGGTVLTGWALQLQCGPFLAALLGALPFFAQFVQFPAAWITTRFGARRTALIAVGLSRLVLLGLALLPLLPLSLAGQRVVLLSVAGLSAMLAIIGNNAWVSWMGDLVPSSIRGRYFGQRTAWCTLGGTLASLAAGMLLDSKTEHPVHVLGSLALLSVALGLVTTWLMAQQHEPKSLEERPRPSLATILLPWRDASARPFLRYQLAWNGAVGIAGPFFALHCLQNLKMGFTLMAVHLAAVAFIRMLAGPIWGRAVDRVGARPVLIVCSFGICLVPLIWLPSREGVLWPLVVDAIVAGILWSGHAVAAFAHPLATTKREHRPFYLAAFSTAGGLAYAATSSLGGATASLIPAHFTLGAFSFDNYHVLFFLSSLARAAAAVLALKIAEAGAQPVAELVRPATERIRSITPRSVPVAGRRSRP